MPGTSSTRATSWCTDRSPRPSRPRSAKAPGMKCATSTASTSTTPKHGAKPFTGPGRMGYIRTKGTDRRLVLKSRRAAGAAGASRRHRRSRPPPRRRRKPRLAGRRDRQSRTAGRSRLVATRASGCRLAQGRMALPPFPQLPGAGPFDRAHLLQHPAQERRHIHRTRLHPPRGRNSSPNTLRGCIPTAFRDPAT